MDFLTVYCTLTPSSHRLHTHYKGSSRLIHIRQPSTHTHQGVLDSYTLGSSRLIHIRQLSTHTHQGVLYSYTLGSFLLKTHQEGLYLHTLHIRISLLVQTLGSSLLMYTVHVMQGVLYAYIHQGVLHITIFKPDANTCTVAR